MYLVCLLAGFVTGLAWAYFYLIKPADELIKLKTQLIKVLEEELYSKSSRR